MPPPDKSISHRAAILAAMGEGTTTIEGYLDSADTRSTLAAVEALGAAVEVSDPGERGVSVTVRGVGLNGPRPAAIDVGNAGTLMRVLPGWLAGQEGGRWTLDGDESIRRRPVDRIAVPLREMGARVSCREDRLPPLVVEGAPLRGGSHRLAVASAQVKSCLLLAGLMAQGTTEVIEPAPSRDHTERMLAALGVEVRTSALRTVPGAGGPPARRVSVEPVDRLEPERLEVPGDFSSAAFFVVAAALVRRSEVRISGVGVNPTRIGLLGILNRMGAAIEVSAERTGFGGEPVADLLVRAAPLRATRVHPEEVPATIDELPLVALAAALADGRTVVRGAAELRHKESDRIAAVVQGLGGLGADVEELPDGFAVTGRRELAGGTIDARGDHRVAMLGAVAGLASRDGVEVRGMEAAGVSYPAFERDIARLSAPA